MRTNEITAYKFDELSDSAKEKAYKEFLNSEHEYFWMDENVESIKKGLQHFDCSMGKGWYIEYHSSRASYVPVVIDMQHAEDIAELSGVRLWKFLNNGYMKYWCKYDKKYENLLDGNCPFTGYCLDENFLDPIREFMKKPTDITFLELMERCVWECLVGIEHDFDYQNSEEFFKEECISNEYEFTEDGNRI
jgi:hypothetical protein